MVRPSNPLLMSAVLKAVARLSEGKGSTVRDILNFVRQNSNGSSRNLTTQVYRALKHAVTAGLLRHQSGRYKVLISVNPISVQPSPPEDLKSADDTGDKVSSGLTKKRIKDSGKQQASKRQPRKKTRSKSRQRKYTRHWKHAEPTKEPKAVRRPRGKSSGKVEDSCDDRIAAPVRRKRLPKRKSSEIPQKELSPSSDRSRDHICDSASDISEDSNRGRSSNLKSNKLHSREGGNLLSPARKKSLIRQEAKGQSSKARSRKRSTSRNRSPQRANYNNQNQQQQQLQLQQHPHQHNHQHQHQQQLEIQEIPNDSMDDVRMDCEQVSGNVECIEEPTNQDTERPCKANNSGSGSSL